MIDFKLLKWTLDECSNLFIQKYREKLEAGGNNATGNLRDSISAVVEVNDQYYSISFNIADYYKNVANGQEPGTWVKTEDLIEWISVKRILPRDGGTLEGFAKAIQLKIFHEGSLGYREHRPNYFDECKEETVDEYNDLIQEALYTDIVDHIDELIEKYIF